jgi:membrane-associated phospholipid phosphatase
MLSSTVHLTSRVSRSRRCLSRSLLVLLLAASSAAAQPPPQDAPAATVPDGQGPEVVPEPAETNWKSLLKDTGSDFVSFPQRKSTWVLLAAGGALALAAHPADDYVETHIVGNPTADGIFSVGKVLGNAYFQIGAAATMYIVGQQLTKDDDTRTHRVTHIGFDIIRAQIVAQALVHGIKIAAQRDRPSGDCCAFPSGHATSAFAAASVLERHFGYRGSWPALLAASYVAASRLVDNRHFLSDVIFGAALGEAIGWTVVGRHGKPKIALQPIPVRGGMMVAFVRVAD